MRNKTEFIFISLLIVSSILLLISIVNNENFLQITGRANEDSAVATVNLTKESSVTVTGSIDFGDGRVNETARNATLDSNAGTIIGGTWTPAKASINVENSGTVNVSIKVKAEANKNAEGFIGGTNPKFQLIGNITEDGACLDLNQTWTDVPNSTETPFEICNKLSYPQALDEFNVSVKLVIPDDAVAGNRNVTLIFSATQTD